MPVPAIEYDWTVQPDLRGFAGRGPTLTCTRNDEYGWAWGNKGFYHYLGQNMPKFNGFHMSDQQLRHSDDLTNVVWTKTNVTVAKNATDIDGNANAAWTITDDATNGQHIIRQTYQFLTAAPASLAARFGQIALVMKINHAASTTRYLFITHDQTVPAIASRSFIIDLQEKTITVDSSTQGMAWSGLNQRVSIFDPDPAGDWIFLNFGMFLSAANDYITIGFADGYR